MPPTATWRARSRRTLDAVADVQQACAAGSRGDRARHRGVDRGAPRASRAPRRSRRAGARVARARRGGRRRFTAVFPIRVLSYITLSMAVDAIVMTGRAGRTSTTISRVVEPTAAEGALRNAANLLAPHLAPRSVWFRNCLRAGLALALSVLVAKASDISHAFWVVLATLSILRSNVVTTGATVVSALVGTLAGFVLATAAITVLGPASAVALDLAAVRGVSLRLCAGGDLVRRRPGDVRAAGGRALQPDGARGLGGRRRRGSRPWRWAPWSRWSRR